MGEMTASKAWGLHHCPAATWRRGSGGAAGQSAFRPLGIRHGPPPVRAWHQRKAGIELRTPVPYLCVQTIHCLSLAPKTRPSSRQRPAPRTPAATWGLCARPRQPAALAPGCKHSLQRPLTARQPRTRKIQLCSARAPLPARPPARAPRDHLASSRDSHRGPGRTIFAARHCHCALPPRGGHRRGE